MAEDKAMRAEGASATGEKRATAPQKRGKTRYLWAAAGFVMFGFGMVGVVLPVLPTTPFMLVAAFCFARSSDRLDEWFKSTKIYKRVLENYVKKRAMTVKVKLSIIVPVTVLLTIAFFLMSRVPVGQAVLVVVWVGHIVYFGFVVKTSREG